MLQRPGVVAGQQRLTGPLHAPGGLLVEPLEHLHAAQEHQLVVQPRDRQRGDVDDVPDQVRHPLEDEGRRLPADRAQVRGARRAGDRHPHLLQVVGEIRDLGALLGQAQHRLDPGVRPGPLPALVPGHLDGLRLVQHQVGGAGQHDRVDGVLGLAAAACPVPAQPGEERLTEERVVGPTHPVERGGQPERQQPAHVELPECGALQRGVQAPQVGDQGRVCVVTAHRLVVREHRREREAPCRHGARRGRRGRGRPAAHRRTGVLRRSRRALSQRRPAQPAHSRERRPVPRGVRLLFHRKHRLPPLSSSAADQAVGTGSRLRSSASMS